MPEFRCLKKTFMVSQEDLQRAPGSVLTTSWNASAGKGVIDLKAWPEPDLRVFEVVLSCLQQRPCDPTDPPPADTCITALDYFAVPLQLWPAGLQLQHRATLVEKIATKDIVTQLRRLALSDKPKYHSGPYCRQEEDAPFVGVYCIKGIDKEKDSFIITAATNTKASQSVRLPGSLAKAVIEEAKLDRLQITFKAIEMPYGALWHQIVVSIA